MSMSCKGPDLRYLIPERKMRTKINDISLSGHLKLLLSGVQCIIDVEWPSHVNRSYYWPLPCAEWPCSFFCSNSKPISLCLVLVSGPCYSTLHTSLPMTGNRPMTSFSGQDWPLVIWLTEQTTTSPPIAFDDVSFFIAETLALRENT